MKKKGQFIRNSNKYNIKHIEKKKHNFIGDINLR